MNIVILLHIVTLVLSISLFFINFAFTIKPSPYLQHAGFIKLRQVIDMLAIMMIALACMVSKRVPFIDPVMTEKLLATLAYVFMVYVTLQKGKNLFFRGFFLAGSIGWLFYVYSLAVSGQTYLLR